MSMKIISSVTSDVAVKIIGYFDMVIYLKIICKAILYENVSFL